MKGVHWAAVGIRFLALWLITNTFVSVPGTFAAWYVVFTEKTPLPRGVSLYPSVIYLAVAIAAAVGLWYFSDPLAKIIWRVPDDTAEKTAIAQIELQTIVLRVLGVYLIVVGVPNLAELAAGYYTIPTFSGLETHFAGRLWARVIGVGFQVAFGSWLLFYPSVLSRFISNPNRAFTMPGAHGD
jgi:hypothetical protein